MQIRMLAGLFLFLGLPSFSEDVAMSGEIHNTLESTRLPGLRSSTKLNGSFTRAAW